MKTLMTFACLLASAASAQTPPAPQSTRIPPASYRIVSFDSLSVVRSKIPCLDKKDNSGPGLALVIKGAVLKSPPGYAKIAARSLLLSPVECGERRTIGAYRAAQILNHVVGKQGNYFNVPDPQVHNDIYAGIGHPRLSRVSTDVLEIQAPVALEDEVEGESGTAYNATYSGSYVNVVSPEEVAFAYGTPANDRQARLPEPCTAPQPEFGKALAICGDWVLTYVGDDSFKVFGVQVRKSQFELVARCGSGTRYSLDVSQNSEGVAWTTGSQYTPFKADVSAMWGQFESHVTDSQGRESHGKCRKYDDRRTDIRWLD